MEKPDKYDLEGWLLYYENKLKQYSDIEEKLGIDLITMFKALTDGFYARSEERFSKIDFYDSVRLGISHDRFVFNGFNSAERLWIVVCVADKYRWALTREELE